MITQTGWRVQTVVLDDRVAFRVTHLGFLMGGGANFRTRGTVYEIEDVKHIMGDAFAELEEED